VKDAAVAEYEEGFMLADVVLGQGILTQAKPATHKELQTSAHGAQKMRCKTLKLPEMVRVLHQANPEIHFSLEMSTRDPLLVPCLTGKYWATLEHVSGENLARVLSMVRAKGTPKTALPRAEHLSSAERVKLEEENIKSCLAYARENMGL
jgi:hypothetical protein